MHRVKVDAEKGAIIYPQEFILGVTEERFSVSNHLIANGEGKSSLGRLGLIIHATAGFIDPGWKGHITLEKLTTTKGIVSYENTAILQKINALQECSLHDILDPHRMDSCVERELIDAVFLFIKSRFSTIQTIHLNDTSYIPCK
jgi:hypothetical protein